MASCLWVLLCHQRCVYWVEIHRNLKGRLYFSLQYNHIDNLCLQHLPHYMISDKVFDGHATLVLNIERRRTISFPNEFEPLY